MAARFRVALVAGLCLALAGCTSWYAANLYHSGTTSLENGDSRRAVKDLERSASLEPHSEVYNNLGLAYAASGREEEALAAFELAVELDCDNAAAAENLYFAEQRARGSAP